MVNIKFQEEKKQEIAKIEKLNGFLESLLEKNNGIDFIAYKDIEKINDIILKNKKLLHKLKSDEFEIAVVGLEKAGKSTFVNALIENDILPSAPERCTFTSTKLSFGEDNAEVEFYVDDEFDTIFKELLKEIEYPNWEKQSYKTLSLEEFERYFDSLSETNPNLYKAHQGKTNEEIQDILKIKNKLTLTGGIKKFSKDELVTDTFKSYIKGEDQGQNTSKPRSTKRLEIYSSKLEKLKTAIIYDVPGFDSPTKIHERQTLERLKEADAIILITNAGRNPSLVGTQLNIITKNSDEDGISLKDKLFVFGNQLDLVNKESDIKQNKEILTKDVLKFNIGKKERIFGGSAYKYLVDKEVIKDTEFSTKFEFENNGLEELHAKLIEYYQTDRFEILKRKIANNKNSIKEIFDELIKNQKNISPKELMEQERAKIIINSSKEIVKTIETELNTLKHELKQEILDEKYLSQKFKEEIQSSNYFQDTNTQEINKIYIKRDNSITKDTPIEKINHYAREEMHTKFLKEYTELILNITDKKIKTTENRIISTIVNATGFNELDTKNFIKDVSDNEAHNNKQFIYLIERFSRDIFDIISHPLGSDDRLNKFKEAQKEFLYLDEFYSGKGDLTALLLNGKKSSLSLSNLPKDILDILDFFSSVSISPTQIPKMMKEINTKAKTLNKLLSTTLNNVIKDINYEELLKDIKRAKTQDEVATEINTDIENLKDILTNGVVPATNLEIAFLNAISKQILSIRSAIEEDNDFIHKVVMYREKSTLDALENKLELLQIQKEIIEEIKKFEQEE